MRRDSHAVESAVKSADNLNHKIIEVLLLVYCRLYPRSLVPRPHLPRGKRLLIN